jgi:hypothetical protein
MDMSSPLIELESPSVIGADDGGGTKSTEYYCHRYD